MCDVHMSENMQKKYHKLPHIIQELFEDWVRTVEMSGLVEMRKTNAFRDHSLKGKLNGLRSSSLNRSYRVIYRAIDEGVNIYVIEVNKHDYKIY